MLIPQETEAIHCRIRFTGIVWAFYITDEYLNTNRIYYSFPEGAFRRLEYELKVAYWRIRAREIIPTINIRTLSVREHEFIKRLIRINCSGMTMRQYGYLKGLQERNIYDGP